MIDSLAGADVDGRYRAALETIWDRSNYDRGFISNPFAGDEFARLGLVRTERVLERLGSPHERMPIVHVAGSKGKGSTCAFAATILSAAGLRTGRYTSPHLHSFRERIAVDGVDIAPGAFAAAAERTMEAVQHTEAHHPGLGLVSAFELTTAMALDHFAVAGCDVAVVEVGLGGTLDATNVVTPAVSVITALDYEHTRVLGRTLAEIAANKAGIIKPGVPVATSPLPAEAAAVVERVAAEQGSRWLMGGRDWTWAGSWRRFSLSGPWGESTDLRSGLAGDHQVENACTAIAAIRLLRDAGLSIGTDAIRRGLAATAWPGRFESLPLADSLAVLDGAHSPASARALAAAFADSHPGQRATVVLALLADKDPAPIAAALEPVAASYVVTETASPRALPRDDLAARIAAVDRPVEVAASVRDALAVARGRALPILVCGSLTAVAEAREALGLAVSDPAQPV